jgi:hypothetical protein
MSEKPTIASKGRYQLKYRGTGCLNCGHPLDMSDKYCPNCSQANSTKKLSFKDFFDEFFSSIVSYDSRLLRTLSAMLTRPGRITADYIKGKRASYTNPFRFLLSLGIIYFLMLDFSGNFDAVDKAVLEGREKLGNIEKLSDLEIPGNNKEQKQALNTLDSLGLIEQWRQQNRKKDSLIMADPAAYYKSIEDKLPWARLSAKTEFFWTLQEDAGYDDFDEVAEQHAIEKSFENKMTFSTARSFFKIRNQPGSFVSSLVSKLPFATFFFLPVFALFISLAYIRKKHTYTDNLIFSFHNQSLLFILLIVSFLVDYIFNVDSSGIFLLIFVVYLYKAMRNFYRQGRFKTFMKFIFINTIFFILAGVAALLLVMGSAFTY